MKALLAFMLAFWPVAAFACTQPFTAGMMPTAEDVAEELLWPGQYSFVAKVKVTSVEEIVPGMKAKIAFDVIKQYVGEETDTYTAISAGNSCGFYEPKVGDIDLIAARTVSGEELPIIPPTPTWPAEGKIANALNALLKAKGKQ